MHRDKKVAAGRLRFVLPDRIGHVELVGDVPDEDVLAALEMYVHGTRLAVDVDCVDRHGDARRRR